jgi:hypothetical protein
LPIIDPVLIPVKVIPAKHLYERLHFGSIMFEDLVPLLKIEGMLGLQRPIPELCGMHINRVPDVSPRILSAQGDL